LSVETANRRHSEAAAETGSMPHSPNPNKEKGGPREGREGEKTERKMKGGWTR